MIWGSHSSLISLGHIVHSNTKAVEPQVSANIDPGSNRSVFLDALLQTSFTLYHMDGLGACELLICGKDSTRSISPSHLAP